MPLPTTSPAGDSVRSLHLSDFDLRFDRYRLIQPKADLLIARSLARRQYICFTERQDFETTVRQHVVAFEHLGGAAATCLYDNMKVVVTRWEDGQPIYNPRFLSFATHYGFKPWACEPRCPETKGKIERPFDYAEKNLLNGRTFRSIAQRILSLLHGSAK